MVNKVILDGVLTRTPYIAETNKGTKKALFTLEITTYEDKASTKYIEAECYGKNAEKIENLKGGEQVYAEGCLYRYKSTKFDKYLMAVVVDKVEVKGGSYDRPEPKAERAEEPKWNNDITFEISDSDLPF